MHHGEGIARLALAVGSGRLALPEGARVAVFRPAAGYDLSPLGGAELHVIQGFRPDHDHFAARYRTSHVAEGEYDAAVVVLPRAKDEQHALVAEAMARVRGGGPVAVDGRKTDGIEPILRAARARAEVSDPISKAHGKLFVMPAGPGFEDWRPAEPLGPFATVPGAFSADGPDRGSMLLAASLPARLPPRLADLGAGWGYLSHEALRREGVQRIDLVEADWAALEAAKANIDDPRARFHWADATRWSPDAPPDWVLTNPPFHRGRRADPSLGRAFVAAAARILPPRGQLWLVANRHLPYEAAMTGAFAETAEVAGDATFKVLVGSRPLAPRRRSR